MVAPIFVFGFDNKPIILDIELSDKVSKEEQWVYWFHLYDNEYRILDSCKIIKGQKKIQLEGIINDQSLYLNWLSFTKKGPLKTVFYVSPGEHVVAYIDSVTPYFLPTEGSPTNDIYCKDQNKELKKRRRELSNLVFETIGEEKKRYKDSLDFLIHYLDYIVPLEKLKNCKNPAYYLSKVDILKCSQSQKDSLIKEMKEQFPKVKQIQMYPEKHLSPPASKESKDMERRFENILAARISNNNKTKEKNLKKVELEANAPPSINDIFPNIELKDVKNKEAILYNIPTPYILIDFWAAWCAPCRKEIPYLKKALEANKDSLTIYAISLDNAKQAWKNAILTDKSEMFTHVYGGNMTTPEGKEICTRFGITAIPANFLLDKDRKIIATNLRGEELMRKMEELIEK
ncbi:MULTISPECIES: TlpA disulfide reductase family protein [unclassified Dysgonomonas]|nr:MULTISPECIES: TlpA disulfide reductase family protein [unclassified Dysgonomonas]